MTKLNVTFDKNKLTSRFPVHFKYADDYQAQPAYISLDLRNGACDAGRDAERGSTPVLQLTNIKLAFTISPQTTADQIEALIDAHKENFQAILDDSTIEWNGSNNVGKFGSKATEILTNFNYFNSGDPEGFQSYDSVPNMITRNDLADFMGDDIYPSFAQDVNDFACEILALDGDNHQYFSDSLNGEDEMLEALSDIWAENLYSGNELPNNVAKYLLEQGTCDDSQWLDELKEFAEAE